MNPVEKVVSEVQKDDDQHAQTPVPVKNPDQLADEIFRADLCAIMKQVTL